ncbi:acyl carrier protein [Litorilituus sediminis]|uniref:Acyl carrier protein n=1 Tax=Litorilituus sediminis TaxID=718192 RepID=A0A4P6P4E8_9GAMM|nr:acyl carrier protein [Litorilituus sediminis]QBG36526.1 acyl carrier protein [Litorilituus sediminis]
MNQEQITQQLTQALNQIIPSYGQDFWTPDTELVGAIAEFDSMAIVTLIGEMEELFDIEFDDEDITGEHFASVASLTQLVQARLG